MATSNLNQTASQLLAALYPVKIVDEKAETAEEIAVRIGKCGSYTRELILAEVKAGRFETVWKRGRIRLVPAYRAAKSHPAPPSTGR